MPTANNNGVSIAYDRAGPRGAPTVAFVEGLGYGRWMWSFQREPLAESYDTIVFDNRGTGASSVPEGPYTIAEMAGDLDAVLDDAGVERAHVVGASMGGMIAMQYGLEYDRAATLSLLCTSHGGPDAVPVPEETRRYMFDVPEEYGEREAIRYKMSPAVTEDFFEEREDIVERIVDWRLETDAPDAAREAQAAAVAAFDVSDRLGELTLPALVLHGTADRVVPVENGEQLCEVLPDVDCEFFEGAPHLLFVEHADAVLDRLRTFLEIHD